MPQASRTRSMTSGFSGSPAPTISRSCGTPGAKVLEDEHPPHRRRRAQRGDACARRARRARAWLRSARSRRTKMVAPAFHGAKKLLQACFAQPGELMFQCTSPSLQSDPVHRGEVADRVADWCVCSTSLRLRRRAGREVEEQAGRRRASPHRARNPVAPRGVVVGDAIPRRGSPTTIRVKAPVTSSNFDGAGSDGDDVARSPPRSMRSCRSAARQQRRGRAEDGAELHRGER